MEQQELKKVEEKIEDAKTVKRNRIIKLSIAGGVVLFFLILFIFIVRPTKFVTCITFLGRDIPIAKEKDGSLDLDSLNDQIQRPGYEFRGWYEDKDFTKEYDVKSFTGKKLYAKYIRTRYTIEYVDIADSDFSNSVKEYNGVKVMHQESFFVRVNDNYGSLNSLNYVDEYFVANWGQELFNTETDRINYLFITKLKDANFKGYEVYKNTDDVTSSSVTPLTTILLDDNGYCKLNKDILISEVDANNNPVTGIKLKAIYA